ncbi:MAG TPA: PilZ domain-containing protein, partial [Bdellovibrionota bacterium]|nr:PilZ domain-containing protein [Bdellovibrionota bacterium]
KSPKAKAPKVDDRRSKAKAALMEALEEEQESSEDEEFDPEAFFAASGGQGIFRAHVMRKERVDLNINVRFRTTGPLVHQAELINLSKDGLCLKTKELYKEDTVLKVEIPLPHTSELFSIQVKVIWSQRMDPDAERDEKTGAIHTGTQFMPMSLAKQSVINTFIQQRRDEIIMAKIGLDKFSDSAPVAGID